jgi:hypothetical protein
MWLKSDNRAQANRNVRRHPEHVADAGTVGLTHIDTTNVDKQYASPAQLERDGMKTYSLRATGNAGAKDLFSPANMPRRQTTPPTKTPGTWKPAGRFPTRLEAWRQLPPAVFGRRHLVLRFQSRLWYLVPG